MIGRRVGCSRDIGTCTGTDRECHSQHCWPPRSCNHDSTRISPTVPQRAARGNRRVGALTSPDGRAVSVAAGRSGAGVSGQTVTPLLEAVHELGLAGGGETIDVVVDVLQVQGAE